MTDTLGGFMFKPIPGSYKYGMALSGEMTTIIGTDRTPVVENNSIKLEMYGRETIQTVEWLSLITHFEVNLPPPHAEAIWDITFIKSNHKATKPVAPFIMRFKEPLLVAGIFRIVPGFTNYAVSESGEVLDIVKCRVLKHQAVSDIKRHYPYVYIYNPDKSQSMEIMVHRLVALAWVDNEDWSTNTIVNHKDGDKQNFHRTNLEWSTQKGNVQHSVQNGLCGSSTECVVRDNVDGQIYIFPSIASACLYMGVSIKPLSSLSYIKPGKLIRGRYEIKALSDDTPWFYGSKTDVVDGGQYTITVTKPNNEQELFYSLGVFKKAMGIWNVSNITQAIDKARNKYPENKFDYIRNYGIEPIQCLVIETGEILEAPSTAAMARKLGLPRTVIRYVLLGGESREYKGYAFRFKSEKPWSKDVAATIYSPVRLEAVNPLTNEKLEFKSLRDAAKHFNVDRSLIKTRLRTGGTFGHWEFKEVVNS